MALQSRRQVMRAAMHGAAGLCLAPLACRVAPVYAQSAASAFDAVALSERLYLLTSAGQANVVAQTQPDGVVLVDGAAANVAEALLDTVAGLPASGSVHSLFNTHWHPQQTGLNERLGAEGTTIIAHENTRLWLTTDITYPWDDQSFAPLSKAAQPNLSFYDTGELNSQVRYGYLRHAAHTDGDMYVQFPEANVLVVGDTVSGAGWPFVDWWTGGWIGGIVGNLELLLDLTDAQTRIVPARGRVLSRADLQSQYEMYNIVYERLSRMLNSGRGPDEAVAAKPTEEFDAIMGPPDEFVRRAFESLWAYLTPDAALPRRQWGVFA